MQPRMLFRLTVTAFVLVYFAAMGSLIVFAMPFFDGLQPFVLGYVMLPAGVAGVVLIAIEKFIGKNQ